MTKSFKALIVNKEETQFSLTIKELALTDLPAGDVLIDVKYSSVNYKDGLASIPNGKIVQTYPFIPGIDLAGVVVSSSDSRYKEGDEVIATSYDIGVSHFGGYSEYARIPAEWIVPLPKGLTLKEAMVLGTAGITAALSVYKLEENGLKRENGPVLVTGATGGVGSLAVAILAKRGYEVIASTGKAGESDYLRELGAKKIISREDVVPEKIRSLDHQLWAGAVDPVGGNTLASILSRVQYGGSVAVSGLTGGINVETTVFPFILRGINLLGIDSVHCPMDIRTKMWKLLANDYKPNNLDLITVDSNLDQLPQHLEAILKGKVRGRVVVSL